MLKHLKALFFFLICKLRLVFGFGREIICGECFSIPLSGGIVHGGSSISFLLCLPFLRKGVVPHSKGQLKCRSAVV